MKPLRDELERMRQERDEARAKWEEEAANVDLERERCLTELEIQSRETERLRRSLGIVGRMAVFGPASDTTPEQTLQTIASFVEARLNAAKDQ